MRTHVACTIAADDDLLVARLAVPLAGVERLDVVTELSFAPGRHRIEDIPFLTLNQILLVLGTSSVDSGG